MATPIYGHPREDQAFLSGLMTLTEKFNRNLSVPTYEKAIDYLRKKCDDGPYRKSVKSQWSVKLRSELGIDGDTATDLAEQIMVAHIEARDAA